MSLDLLDQADQVAIELTLAIKGGDIPAGPAIVGIPVSHPRLRGADGRSGRRPGHPPGENVVSWLSERQGHGTHPPGYGNSPG